MRRGQWLIVGVLAGVCLTGPVTAQDDAAAEAREIERGQAEMRAARERLEEAAREVARLSAERVGPVGREGFIYRDIAFGRPMLGLNIENAEDGVEVVGVTPNGPADEAGVEAGDLIVAIDGHELSGTDEATPTQALLSRLSLFEPGDVVALSLRRDGRSLGVEVETRASGPEFYALGGRPLQDFPGGGGVRIFGGGVPAEPGREYMFFNRSFFGGRWRSMELVELTPELGAYFGVDEGLLVVRAPQDDELELVDGDVILTIGGRTPTSAEHAMRILGSFEPGETLELEIMRQQRRQTISLEVPADSRWSPLRIQNF